MGGDGHAATSIAARGQQVSSDLDFKVPSLTLMTPRQAEYDGGDDEYTEREEQHDRRYQHQQRSDAPAGLIYTASRTTCHRALAFTVWCDSQ